MIKEKATPHIGLVTDLTTGQIDGKITPGGMVLVTGCNIKIENGNKPVCEAIQLAHQNGEVICIDPPFEMNEPHILKFKIPDSLPTGEYTLTIKTRFAGKYKRLLTQEQTLVYMLKLIREE